MITTLTLNPAIDLNMEIAEFDFDHPVRAKEERRRAGGKGINVSAALEILGTASEAIVCVGGHSGEEFLELARDRYHFGINAIRQKSPTRTNTVISSRADGRQLKVNQAGGAITREELDLVRAKLSEIRTGIAALCGSLPPGAPSGCYGEFIRLLRDRGIFTAVDCEGEPLHKALNEKPDLIKPNRQELERLVGKVFSTEAEMLAYAAKIANTHDCVCALTDGARKAFLITPAFALASVPPEANGSPVGAGDSFLAGLLHGILPALPKPTRDQWADAFRMAVACGSASASTPDTELFSRELFDRYLARVSVQFL